MTECGRTYRRLIIGFLLFRPIPARLSSKLDKHAVVGGLDIVRQLTLQGLVIEIQVKMCEDRPLAFQGFDPVEGLSDGKVARMKCVAQRVHDPHIETFQQRARFGWYAANIRRIGDPSEAEAKRRRWAMIEHD